MGGAAARRSRRTRRSRATSASSPRRPTGASSGCSRRRRERPNAPTVPWGTELNGADDVNKIGHLFGGTHRRRVRHRRLGPERALARAAAGFAEASASAASAVSARRARAAATAATAAASATATTGLGGGHSPREGPRPASTATRHDERAPAAGGHPADRAPELRSLPLLLPARRCRTNPEPRGARDGEVRHRPRRRRRSLGRRRQRHPRPGRAPVRRLGLHAACPSRRPTAAW